MRISKQLNLVVPFKRGADPGVYVHSTPISLETFESYYSVIGKAFNKIYSGGFGPVGGPPIADLIMREIAVEDGTWENRNGKIGVKEGLIAEIRRRTNVFKQDAKGAWEMIPYEDARASDVFDEDEVRIVEGSLCFFTALSRMHMPEQRQTMLDLATSLLGAQITSLSCTEWRSFLSTSTTSASSGGKMAASSAVSSNG